MTDEEILLAEEALQTTFNEDSINILVEEGVIENVCD